MMNVSVIVRSMLTPMSAEVSESWATARMPRPSRVERTMRSAATNIAVPTTRQTTWIVWIGVLPMKNMV